MSIDKILKNIDSASNVVGKTWPLYAFVTSNPLTGYENYHFKDALTEAEDIRGGMLYPDASVYEDAWQRGEIHDSELRKLLSLNKIDKSPEECLQELKSIQYQTVKNPNQDLDATLVKWLMAFMDEGLAEWDMPNKDKGFFLAWRSLVDYDGHINRANFSKIPFDCHQALVVLLEQYSEVEQLNIIKYHIAALPGWTGYIKFRKEDNSLWQDIYDLDLQQYLAVRLSIAKLLNIEILPEKSKIENIEDLSQIQYVWLKAWETSFQNRLSKHLAKQVESAEKDKNTNIDAQLVFCIDTRSELIRRHIESKGDYETFGYAGFFGIAMDYNDLDSKLNIKSCPPILNSAYLVKESSKSENQQKFEKYDRIQKNKKFKKYFLGRMKNMLPSAFGFVEGSGIFYGISMIARTLFPHKLYNPRKKQSQSHEGICEPVINQMDNNLNNIALPIEEKVTIVKSAFSLLGWRTFAPLVIFAGHGGHSKNNAFASSLDCGACAASPGRHNARMLAKLANDNQVRELLKKDDIIIPQNTVFLGAEHNTTTDEIIIFDSEVPETHKEKLTRLKKSLNKAQQTATQERYNVDHGSVKIAHQKTNDWSETRPEWGLAKNSGFIIGSRGLTKNLNLNGHCFLHSYDWELDPNGTALEGIMQGPMVVTQWINNHYYFSTVDNQNYGGGSKIFHNVTGQFGVVDGNGSDLKIGLPLQSVYETDDKPYHQPLRLSVFIHAPKNRVKMILDQNENLKSLLDNEWIYLLVIDPTEENTIHKYYTGINWKVFSEKNIKVV